MSELSHLTQRGHASGVREREPNRFVPSLGRSGNERRALDTIRPIQSRSARAARGIRAQLSVLVRVQQRSWLVARGILADFAQAHEFYQNANVAVIPFQDRGEVGALDPQQAGALD